MTSEDDGTGVVALRSAIFEFVREPLNVGLVLVLPPLFVRGYGQAMQQFPQMPFMSAVPMHLGLVNGAMAAAAFLPGIIGLFQVISARRADGRLLVAGFDRSTLFVARYATVAIVAVIGSALSILAVSVDVTPDRPVLAFAALVVAGLIYGGIGMLIAAVVPRELEGSLILVFVTDIDEFMSSGLLDVESAVTHLFPLYYPHSLFETAVLDGPPAVTEWILAVAYLLVVGTVALVVYAELTEAGGAVA
ncbi:MAG: ABC transporter permease [Halanaeroarchaeum sp.]